MRTIKLLLVSLTMALASVLVVGQVLAHLKLLVSMSYRPTNGR